MQKFQKRAFGIIEASKVKDAWNKNLMKINQLMAFDRVVMTSKIFNQLCSEGQRNKFIEGLAVSKYNTRNKRDLFVQKLTLEHAIRGFVYWPSYLE